MDLNDKIICSPLPEKQNQDIFGSDISNANVVFRSSKNEELLYLDGACGPEPIFLGLTKSRGSQYNKLPVEPGDFLGGIQVYARTSPGESLGYKHEETPLVGAIQFKVSDEYIPGKEVLTKFLVALTDEDGSAIKLVLDNTGNLRISGNISLGNLTITDKEIKSNNVDESKTKFVLVNYQNQQYAMPLYSIKK